MLTDAPILTALFADGRYFQAQDASRHDSMRRINVPSELFKRAERLAATLAVSSADLLDAALLLLLARSSGDSTVSLASLRVAAGRTTSLAIRAHVAERRSFSAVVGSLARVPIDLASGTCSVAILVCHDGARPPLAAEPQAVVDVDIRQGRLSGHGPGRQVTPEAIGILLDNLAAFLPALLADPDHAPLPPTRPAIGRRRTPAGAARDANVWGTVPSAFLSAVRRFADSIAVEDENGGRLSYRELDAATSRLAAVLHRNVPATEARVAIFLDRTVLIPVAMLAILRAGMAYVPIDVETPRERIRTILETAKVAEVVTENALAPLLPDGPWLIRNIDARPPATTDAPMPSVEIGSDSLAYVIFTSGSTGTPKGVMIEHRSLLAFVDAATTLYPLSSADRFLLYSSTMFDVATFDVFAALLNGASLVVASAQTRQSARRLEDLMRRKRVTVYMGTPGILEFLDPDALPDLRVMPVGGESMAGRVANRWRPGRTFFNSYGPTETTVAVVAHRCCHNYDLTPPIGCPMPHHEGYLLDARMRPVAPGEIGELYIGGPGVGRGYFGLPARTAAAFVPDPFSGRPGARLYRTGDLARRLHTGEIVFVGRADRQVKVRGHRVELGELEAVLQTCPAVVRAVATAEDQPDGHRALVAYIVAADGVTADIATILGSLRDRLPSYMLPRQIHIVDEIPLQPTGGKTDFDALRASVRASAAARAIEPALARTPTEKRVAEQVVSPILGHNHFDVDDDLLEHGVDSIQIIRICARIEDVFGAVVEPQEFFEHATIRALSSLIDRLAREGHR